MRKETKDPLSRKVHGIGIEQRYIGMAIADGLDLNVWISMKLADIEHLKSNISSLQNTIRQQAKEGGGGDGNEVS